MRKVVFHTFQSILSPKKKLTPPQKNLEFFSKFFSIFFLLFDFLWVYGVFLSFYSSMDHSRKNLCFRDIKCYMCPPPTVFWTQNALKPTQKHFFTVSRGGVCLIWLGQTLKNKQVLACMHHMHIQNFDKCST